MKVEKFLEFWSHNNTLIIELLIGVVLLMSIYLAYRGFFGAKEEGTPSGGSSTSGIDITEIEKSLQKILENQKNVVSAPVVQTGSDSSEEVGALKGALSDKEKELALLKQQLELQAKKAQEELATAKAAAASGGGDTKALETKIKDLEVRLSEYEIISEDISELSKYKEENLKLKNQLKELKGGGGGEPAAEPQSAPAAEPPAPEVQAEPAAAESQPAPTEAAAPAPTEVPAAQGTPSGEQASGGGVVDDDLMKEFAAAIADQKSGTLDQAKAATSKDGENTQLLGEFENFVKKN